VDFSAVFYFRDIYLESLKVGINLLRDCISSSAASEGFCDNLLEFTATIGNEALDKLTKWNVSDYTLNFIGNVFHLIKQLVKAADELHLSWIIQKTKFLRVKVD